MKGICIPYGCYPNHPLTVAHAKEYAGWIALAYAITGDTGQAEEILTCLRELSHGRRHRVGFHSGHPARKIA